MKKTIIFLICNIVLCFGVVKAETKSPIYKLIDKRSLTISSSFDMIFLKNDKFKFISKFASKELSFSDKKNLMSADIIDICNDIYNGENGFIVDKSEGMKCLKLFLLSGHGKSSHYISKIHYNNKDYQKASIFNGIQTGLSYKNNSVYNRLIDNVGHKSQYISGLLMSMDIKFLYTNIVEPVNYYNDFFNYEIDDETYYLDKSTGKKSDLVDLYAYLLSNNLDSFLKRSILLEINGRNLVLLSRAKAGDIDAFSEYCSNIKNKSLSNFCLKKIFSINGNDKSISYFTSRMIDGDNSASDVYFLMGFQNKNEYNESFIKKQIKSNIYSINKLENIVSSYNMGSIYKKIYNLKTENK
jgi:hypothetical protein